MFIDHHFFISEQTGDRPRDYHIYDVEIQIRIENKDLIGHVDPERVGKCLKAASKAFKDTWTT